MKDVNTLARIVDTQAPRLTRLSDEIWDAPELRWAEHASVAKQIAAAEELGFTVHREVTGIPTAFWAEKGSGGPLIAVLGEFDALAGLSTASGTLDPVADAGGDTDAGHGCGHNLLGSGSLLAAAAAAQYLEENGLPGTVRYYGCPAEEAAAGKTFMVQRGAFDGVDGAVSWHPGPSMSVMQMLSLSYSQVYFRFTGVASHAGASPHLGRSALDAVELLNVGANFLREHMPDTARVHYAITDAGGHSPNVIQAQASVYYIVRGATVAEMQSLYERVCKIAHGAALMTETELTVEFDGACAELLPNVALERAMHANFTELGGVPFDAEDQRVAAGYLNTYTGSEVRTSRRAVGAVDCTDALHTGVPDLGSTGDRHQMTGSTDVGDVSWTVPTVQVAGATGAFGTPAHSWQMVAQGKLPAAHKGMVHAAKLMAATVVDMAADDELLAAAKAEHADVTARTPYVCPIPEGTEPPPLRRAAQR